MKMQKPEMEVVSFLAEDVIATSDTGNKAHYLVNGVLHTPDDCAGLPHVHVLTDNSVSFGGEVYDADGIYTGSGVQQSKVDNVAAVKSLVAAGDDNVWLYKKYPNGKWYYICPNSGK